MKKDVESGYKRASLGSYCYVEGDCICYTGLELSEDININMDAQVKEMFSGVSTCEKDRILPVMYR